MLEEAFLCSIVSGASKTGEIDYKWDFVKGIDGGLWGQVKIEAHLAIGGSGIVGKLEELTPKGGDCCLRLY